MNRTNKILIAVFGAVIVTSAVISCIKLFETPAAPDPIIREVPITLTVPATPDLTIVSAPAQTQAERPDAFPDPRVNWVTLPDGANLAEGKPIAAGEVTEVYAAVNAVDGDTNTYWESKGVPAEITVNLQAVRNVATVGVRLNPAPLWEPRKQTFEVLVSADGENYTSVAPETLYDFDPATGNIVRVDFAPVPAQYVRLIFTANTAGRSNGAQAAEIMVFE